jgi:hypothetical protein
MRCLEKDPARRFPSYAALRAALMPFGSAATLPAKPGIRLVAGVIDALFTLWLEFIALIALGETTDAWFISTRTLSSFAFWAASAGWAIGWFAVSEAVFGESLGKLLCGLRVATVNGQPPCALAALGRSLLYNLGLLVMPPVAIAAYSAERYHAAVASGELLPTDLIMFGLWLALFITMRRRNGWAAIHDLLTGTRVVAVSSLADDRACRIDVPAREFTPAGERIGAFTVTRRAGPLIEAFDENLRRGVWIVPVEPSAGMLSQARRELARPTRLRWLQGSRDGGEGWDAFETPVGVPLTALLNGAQPWARVRCWLDDLAAEFSASLRDGTVPPTAGLNQVWITADGRAVLLEFPAPGAPPVEAVPIQSAADVQRFLTGVANAALSPVRPMHASELLQTLEQARLEEPALVAGNIRAALAEPAEVSPRRRATSVALWPAVSLAFALLVSAIMVHEFRWFQRVWLEKYPELPNLRRALEVMPAAVTDSYAGEDSPPLSAMNTHIAGYYGKVVEDDEFWKRPEVQAVFWPSPGKTRRTLRDIITTHGAVSPEELAAADQKLKPFFAEWKKNDDRAGRQTAWACFTGTLAMGVLISLVWTVITGTPLGLRVCGLSLVRWEDGRKAGRIRAIVRLLLGWAPALLALIALGLAATLEASGIVMAMLFTACLGILAASLVIAMRRPDRGFADLLCGTAIVPR